MNRIDDLLRQTIEEMTGDISASRTLARTAMVKGGRMRRRRRLATMAGALVAFAAIAVPLLVIPRGETGPNVGPNTGPQIITDQPVTLAQGWLVNSAGSWYLDRERRAYVDLSAFRANTVWRAPVGDRILVNAGYKDYRLVNVSGDDPVTISDPDLTGSLQWSPRGDRLAGQIMGGNNDFGIGFAVIDAATGTLTKHWFDHKVYDCSQCGVRWSRDGRELMLAIANRAHGEESERVSELQLFDATTGAPTRQLPLHAMPSSPFSWSPDGKYVIAGADVLRGQLQLINVATGAATPFAYDAMWVTNDLLLSPEGDTVLTLRRDGTIIARATLGGAFAGQATITVGPPG